MALNDFDLPASYISTFEQQSNFDDAMKALALVGHTLALLLTLLPEFLQDAVLEGNVNAAIGPMLLILAILSQVSVALPIAVVIAAVALLLVREYFANKRRMNVKKIKAPIVLPHEEEVRDDDLALLHHHEKLSEKNDLLSKDVDFEVKIKSEGSDRWIVDRHALIVPVNEVEEGMVTGGVEYHSILIVSNIE
jgi:hypothetical protein